MAFEALFSPKNKNKKKIRMSSAAVVTDALRIEQFPKF